MLSQSTKTFLYRTQEIHFFVASFLPEPYRFLSSIKQCLRRLNTAIGYTINIMVVTLIITIIITHTESQLSHSILISLHLTLVSPCPPLWLLHATPFWMTSFWSYHSGLNSNVSSSEKLCLTFLVEIELTSCHLSLHTPVHFHCVNPYFKTRTHNSLKLSGVIKSLTPFFHVSWQLLSLIPPSSAPLLGKLESLARKSGYALLWRWWEVQTI